MAKVFVVTGLDLGWDCVVAVFSADTVSVDALGAQYKRPDYVISELTVETEFFADPELDE